MKRIYIKNISISAMLLIITLIITISLSGCDNKPSNQIVSDSQTVPVEEYAPPTADEVKAMIADGKTQYDGDYAVPVHLSTPAAELSIPDEYSWQSLDDSICTVSDSDIIIGTAIGDTSLWCVDSNHNIHTVGVRVRKAAYLTVDDWPKVVPTTQMLNTFKEKNVKATYFLCYDKYMLPLYKQIYDGGHTIGNHTLNHHTKTMFDSSEAMFKQFNDMNDFLEKEIGVRSNIIRIPGGTTSATLQSLGRTKRKEYIKQLHDSGFKIYDWTLSFGDTSVNASVNFAVYNTVDKCYRDFEIILLHNKKSSADALPIVIDKMREKGYEFFPITASTPEWLFWQENETDKY